MSDRNLPPGGFPPGGYGPPRKSIDPRLLAGMSPEELAEFMAEMFGADVELPPELDPMLNTDFDWNNPPPLPPGVKLPDPDDIFPPGSWGDPPPPTNLGRYSGGDARRQTPYHGPSEPYQNRRKPS